MASTATNKQPLLVDRPLHKVYNVSKAITGSVIPTAANATIDITGTNTCIAAVNAIGTDGAIIEDFYLIGRGTTQYWVNLYFSSAADFLRTDAIFIGQLQSGNAQGVVTRWTDMPHTLAPVPQFQANSQASAGGNTQWVGESNTFQSLFVPSGICLWAGIQIDAEATAGPIAGFSGGWY